MTEEPNTKTEIIPKAISLCNKAVILTALGLEYSAIRHYINNPSRLVHPDGSIYERGDILLNNVNWEVYLVETGAYNVSAAKETERALSIFKPNVVFFIGIAGGIKDVDIGDVVSSTKVYGYEPGKAEEELHARPLVYSPSNLMLHLSRQVVREQKWINRISPSSQYDTPRAFNGPIVAGEKVIASKESPVYKYIKLHYGDALAVEMEGLGFLQVASDHREIDALLIRGISDLIENKSKSDAEGSQERAAKNASAFAIEILANYGQIQNGNEQLDIFTRIPGQNSQLSNFSDNHVAESQKQVTIIFPGAGSISIPDSTPESLQSEYHAELNNIKNLLNDFNPTTALLLLKSLKDRALLKASADVKYRLLTNEAVANIQLSKFSEGGRLLIEALQYNPEDEKAIGNVAFGYLLNKNYERSLEFAAKVLERNPLSPRAYSVIIQSKIHEEPIEKILPTIPIEVQNTQDVAEAIGFIYHNLGKYSEATHWLEIAINNQVENSPNLKALYASSLLNKVKTDNSTLEGLQLSIEHRHALQKSIELFTDAWNLVANDTQLQKGYSIWLTERGIAKRILGLKDEALKDITDSYSIDSTNPVTIALKGLVEFELGNYSLAESLFNSILWNPATPSALWVYHLCLSKLKKFDFGIEKINEYLQEPRLKEQQDTLYHFLIAFHIDKGREFFPKAKSIALSRYQEDCNDILRCTELVKVLQFIGEKTEIDNLLKRLSDLYSDTLPEMQKLEIAEVFLNNYEFEKAISIYESVIDPKSNTIFTQKLIDGYYLSGNLKQTLKMCQCLHAIHGQLPHSTTIELAIYHKVGDLIQARKICEHYLEKYPKDYEMQLNQAIVDFRLGNHQFVLEFLKKNPSFEKMTYSTGAKLAQLFYTMGQFDKAIQLAYHLRRKNYHTPEAHLDYIRLILDINDRSTLLGYPQIIAVDTVVQVEDQFGTVSYYSICDSTSEIQEKNEIKINSDLGKRLVEKSEGQSIILQKTPFVENSIIIKKILTKYTFAFQESVRDFNQLFPDSRGIYKISFGWGSEGKPRPEDVQNLQRLAKENQDGSRSLIEAYKRHELTIFALSNAMRLDIFTLCSYLSHNSDIGIFCCSGNTQNRENAKKSLTPGCKIIVDPVALYSIHSLNIGNLLIKKYGRLGIAQSTIDTIQSAILDYSGQKTTGYMTLIQLENGQLAYVSTTPEQITEIKENLERLLSWAKLNCETIPCYGSLEIEKLKLEEYHSILGVSAVDSILLASQPNYIFYSDDGLLQVIATQMGAKNSVWTQILLMDLNFNQIITNDTYHDFLIKLIINHFYHTSINAETLLYAAKTANWEDRPPFVEVLETIKEGRSDLESSVKVGFFFTELIWRQSIDVDSRNYLLIKLLHVLTVDRDEKYVKTLFSGLIENDPRLSPSQKGEIFDVVELFYTTLR
jgi:nucleoside phosphorylase/transcription elongation GreA/GreB family factor